MSSIFRKDDNYVDKPKRNTFDLSFQNNLTTRFGKLTPVLCQEVLPGDSFRIDPSFGLRFMPQKFPTQTRQRASVKFYYVRNRPLWKDWMDFIGKTKQGLVSPYIEFGHTDDWPYYLRPSSIADYMGVPIKVDVPYGSNKKFKLGKPWIKGNSYTYVPGGLLQDNTPDPFAVLAKKNISSILYYPTASLSSTTGLRNFEINILYGGVENVSTDIISAATPLPIQNSTWSAAMSTSPYVRMFRHAFVPSFPMKIVRDGTANGVYLICRTPVGEILVDVPSGTSGLQFSSNKIQYNALNGSQLIVRETTIESIVGMIGKSEFDLTEFSVNIMATANENICWCDLDLDELPYASTLHPDRIRISAIPFRALEAAYNALVRNVDNNPFLIDGVPEYNRYTRDVDGGAQTGLWKLLDDYFANWSDDRFTTSLQSPQMGRAPLIGLTGVQGATLTTSTEDGTTSTLHLQVDADTGNVVLVDGVSSNAPEYLNDIMMSAVEYGITINDIRNVNSFQRWLENNVRNPRYKEQLRQHYGVSARFDVLDMPEFIGGVTRDVSVTQVTQTVENEYGNLGDYGGQSYVMGEGHAIEHYCDEHGFIIGLLDIKPMPLYQDTLPKYLIKQDPFDYYFPEFGNIGMQPISNKELAFSLSVIDGTADKTFGYQRPWYDYLENLDSVHGGFRFDLRSYLVARDFGVTPVLGSDFLTVNSDDVNNTFYSDDDEDKILGQIYLNIKAKRPIPLIGIPHIE